MRQRVLLNSIERVVGDAHRVDDAVTCWFSHRWSMPFSGLAAVATGFGATAVGFTPTSALALAMAAGALAVFATTEYWILAFGDEELLLLRSGRIRQIASGGYEVLAPDAVIERIGGNVATAQWRIADRRLTTMRRGDLTLLALTRRRADP